MEKSYKMSNGTSTSAKKAKGISYAKWGYLFLIPFFLVYLIFTLFPQFLTIFYSFTNAHRDPVTLQTSLDGENFALFDNYLNVFKPTVSGEIEIFTYLGNTVIMWLLGAIPQFVVALVLAMMFTSTRLNLKGTAFFKSMFYLPNLIMATAFAALFQLLFSNLGPINKTLISWGLMSQKHPFKYFENSWVARSIVALVNYIMWFGNTTILLMAGIQGIDESLFESARLDGASSTKVFTSITMPLLKPIFVYTLITSMIGGLQMFDAPVVMGGKDGNPGHTTMTMVMYLNRFITEGKYGMAGAIAMVIFVITGILSIFVFRSMDREV